MADIRAVALADQLQAAVMERAQRLVWDGLRHEGADPPDEDAQLYIDMGIATGMTATMIELINLGALKAATPEGNSP